MKYKTELTNKVQLCFSLRKYQKNLSDNWKVSHQWICADKACILQVELAADTEYSCSRLNLQARSLRRAADQDVHKPDDLPRSVGDIYHKIRHLCQAFFVPMQPEIHSRRGFSKQR